MPWASEDDLLVGDVVTIGGTRQKYLEDAETEILVHLTAFYSTPLPANDALPEHVFLLLKQVHARLASGRMLLSLATSQEDDSLHAYGLSLLNEARTELMRIGTQVPIPGATPAQSLGEDVDNDRRGSVLNVDTESPFEVFAGYTSKAGIDIWEPYE